MTASHASRDLSCSFYWNLKNEFLFSLKELTLGNENADGSDFASPGNTGIVAGIGGIGVVDLQTANPRRPVAFVAVQVDVDGTAARRFASVQQRSSVLEPHERSAPSHHLII